MTRSATAPLPWPHRGVLALVAAAGIAPYPFATFTPDTARDVEAALRIVSGSAFATQGAVIAGTLHVGPIWFYILAAIIAVTRNLAGASLLVGALAALKFPFAYLAGRALGGWRMGFWIALAVAIPGTAALDAITWSHVSVVAALAWLTLACAARAAADDDPRWVLATGAALGLALHGHPTAIVLAPALFAQVAATRRLDSGTVAALLGAAALAALPIVASILANGDGEQAAALARIVGAHANSSGFRGALDIADALLFTVPRQVMGATLHHGGVAGRAEVIAQYMIWAVALLGLVRIALARSRYLGLAATALFFCALAIAFVAALRPFTPYYMATAAWSGATLAAGLGFHALASASPASRVAVVGAACMIVVLDVAIAAGGIARAIDGWIRSPLAAGLDLKDPGSVVVETPLFPALTRDALGRALCAAPSAVNVHGEFATALDLSFAQETALACGQRNRALVGGASASASHWVGLPMHAVHALALQPARMIGTYAAFEAARVLGPGEPHAIAGGERYPPHRFEGALQRVAVRFSAPANASLIVTNPLPWYLPVRDVAVRRDGAVTAAAVDTPSLRAWRCSRCAATEVEWTLELRTVDPAWIDVVLLR